DNSSHVAYPLPVSVPEETSLNAVHGASDTDVWMAGSSGYVFRATSNQWADVDDIEWEVFDLNSEIGISVDLYSIWVTSPAEVWACGATLGGTGVIVRGEYDGQSWS